MTAFTDDFLSALTQSFKKYKAHGARSKEKLMPIHQCIARYVQKTLGSGYAVKSPGVGDGKEQKVSGKYYPKVVDIAVINKGNGKPVSVICFKFVTSNYKQNNINYFEIMMGETANLRRNGCGVVQIIVLRNKTPYYDKDGNIGRTETLSGRNLSKYVKLHNDMDYPHQPDMFHIVVVDINEHTENVRYCTPDELEDISEEIKKALFGEISIATFAEKFEHLCILKK